MFSVTDLWRIAVAMLRLVYILVRPTKSFFCVFWLLRWSKVKYPLMFFACRPTRFLIPRKIELLWYSPYATSVGVSAEKRAVILGKCKYCLMSACRTKLREGNVFTGVCLSIGEGCVGLCHRDPPGQRPPSTRQRPPPPPPHTHPTVHLMPATAAGGTQHTGMQSCSEVNYRAIFVGFKTYKVWITVSCVTRLMINDEVRSSMQ